MTDNILTRIRDRQNARRLRRRLNPSVQAYVDQVSAEIWSESGGDIGLAESTTIRTLQMDGRSLRFDPTTILLIIQLMILIYKILKHFEVFNPSPEFVTAMFEGEE